MSEPVSSLEKALESIPETFGDRVKTARKAAGITQEAAARNANLSFSYWVNIEHSYAFPHRKFLKLRAKFKPVFQAGGILTLGDQRRIRAAYFQVKRIADALNTTVEALTDGLSLES